jgi:hypothetical protein
MRRALALPRSPSLALTRGALATLASFAGLAVAVSACSAPMTLHAPTCAPAGQRPDATIVELAPLVATPTMSGISLGSGDWNGTDVAAVVTSGMSNEIRARSLRGGAGARFAVRCTLDRFAIRKESDMTQTHLFGALYADLSCEAARAADGVLVFRGELRGRAAATASSVLSSDDAVMQRLADRMTSDVTRELASDLVVRALGLASTPSQRVFESEEALHLVAGVDDLPLGALAVGESPARIPQMLATAAGLEVGARAALWNAVAISVGPGDAWPAGAKLALDDEDFVRFYQYKALARLASPLALAQLREAAGSEPSPLLAELLADALSTGGIGIARHP